MLGNQDPHETFNLGSTQLCWGFAPNPSSNLFLFQKNELFTHALNCEGVENSESPVKVIADVPSAIKYRLLATNSDFQEKGKNVIRWRCERYSVFEYVIKVLFYYLIAEVFITFSYKTLNYIV